MFKPKYNRGNPSAQSEETGTNWSELINHTHQVPSVLASVERFYRERLAIRTAQWVSPAEVFLDASLPDYVVGRANNWAISHPYQWQRAEIRLQPGLSRLYAAGVMTHELFHVISAARGLKLGQQLEEGMANLAQYLYLKHHGDEAESKAIQYAMLCNSDPIYGNGFRLVRSIYKKQGGFESCILQLDAEYNPISH